MSDTHAPRHHSGQARDYHNPYAAISASRREGLVRFLAGRVEIRSSTASKKSLIGYYDISAMKIHMELTAFLIFRDPDPCPSFHRVCFTFALWAIAAILPTMGVSIILQPSAAIILLWPPGN